MLSALSRLAIVAGALTVLLVPAPAQAQAPPDLPVGESRGVRLVQERGHLFLVFTPRSGKLRQRINSPYAWLSCTELGRTFVSSGGGNLDVPRTGRRVNTGFRMKGVDFCRVFLRAHTVKRGNTGRRVGRRILFSIPLTQQGAVFLDEEAKALRILTLSGVAALVARELELGDRHPTYAQLVGEVPSLRKAVVALATPDASPPPKRLGYYGDGQHHLVVAMLSASGKRLFIEFEPGDVLRTNVAGHIFGERP